jgi:hypothetical protein
MKSCLKKYKLGYYSAQHWFEHLRGTSEHEFHSRMLETFETQGTRDSVFQIMEHKYILEFEPSISILFGHRCVAYQACVARFWMKVLTAK